jgi:hypothetical protein
MPAAAPARKAARATSATASATAVRRAAVAGQMIPVAVGRTAGAVRRLPDSTLVHQMTRGRLWIAVLGVLLTGIVALNVATLSFDSSVSKMERKALDLEQRNSALRAGLAQKLSHDRVEAAAFNLGMARPATDQYVYLDASKASAALAAERVAAAVTNGAVAEPVVSGEDAADPYVAVTDPASTEVSTAETSAEVPVG